MTSYRERVKVGTRFYLHLLYIFAITMLAGACVLGFLWFWLSDYERKSPEGSLHIYLNNIRKGNYSELYEESKNVFYQLNDEETYAKYLKQTYQNVDLSKAGFVKLSYSDNVFSYYDIIVDGDYVASLQSTKADDGKRYYVRTNFNQYNYFFEKFNDASSIKVNDLELIGNISPTDNMESRLFEGSNTPNDIMVTRYYLDNILKEPVVTTDDPKSVVVKDLANNVYYIGDKPDKETLSTYEDLIYKVATTYCKYITKDAMYYEIRRLLYPNTTFQEALSTFENTWFTDHQSIEFKNVKIFDVMEFDEGFIGSISFDYVVIADDEVSKTYTSTYQLTFMNRYGQYLASNLKIGE